MRISDWSSDVCSSDLAWFAQRLGHGNPWFRGRLLMVTANSYRHRLFNGDTGVCWPDADGNPVVWFEQDGQLAPWSPGQLPQHDTAFEIGRASLRERMCKYV